MSRLAEKLQSSLFFTCTATRFISRLILSTFRLCNSLFTKTLTLTALLSPPSARLMDHDDNSNINNSSSNLFSNDDDDHLLDFDLNPSSSLQNYFYSFSPSGFIIYPAFREEDDRLKLYLVPYRWWKEAQQLVADQKGGGGVVYRVSSNCDTDNFQIVLELKKLESFQESGNGNKDGSLGCEYALLPEGMWLRALKWHNDIKLASGNVGSPFIAGSYLQDVFPLQIRLSVLLETNSLVVKINLKDNKVNLYKRAYNIFISVSKQLFIWDFSGHTTQFFMNDRVNLSNDFTGQSEEILLELQVHGFSDSLKESTDDMIEHPNTSDSFCHGSFKMNGIVDNLSPYTIPSTSICGSGGFSFLGLTGLQNLGNTCFMNSAIQCLAHTPELVDYFLGDYQKEINYDNPLGLKGELALAFGDLVRKIWSPGAMPIAPRMFKLKLVNFAPQFSGYNQHDSQEFLAFLLDGLHEDLNRVKCKPYIEAKDTEGRLEKEVAEEYWRNHRARNDSIIVDLCQGQYRSMLVCPNCKKVSVTFDPLMYLSLPLPSTTMRTMTVTVFSSDGSTLPIPLTVTVPKYGRTKDLIEALNISCSLRDEETLVVAEIYKNQIFRFLEEPSDSLALIRDEDKLVAYRLPKDNEASSLIVFVHRRRESESTSHLVQFGAPLVARLTDLTNGSDICNMFLKLLDPFLMPVEDVLIDLDDTAEDSYSPTILDNDAGSDTEIGDELLLSPDFQFYYMGGQEETQVKMNEPISISEFNKPLNIIVNWSDKMSEKYDTHLLGSLLDVFKPQLWTRKPQESVSLYKCLEAFLKEEPLGPEDMWYCPRCQRHRQASKKLDLWRLPDILVIHLKRFSYGWYLKSKLETYVDFPIDDLDLSTYISHKDSQLSHRYVLYAISNHYGGMGGGHYTAFVDLGHKRWFEFDDDKVYPVSEEQIKTSAAYVLFYRRILDV